MKKIILCLVIFSMSFSGPASSHAAESQSQDLLLFSLIAKRCHRYLPADQVHACQQTVIQMLGALDYHIIFPMQGSALIDPQAFIFVAFKKNLINLLSGPETTIYLKQLNEKLNQYLLGKYHGFNLWKITENHYGSKMMAAQVLAALFQDISLTKLHLAYLENTNVQGRMNFKLNKDLLSQIIETINLVIDYSPDNFQNLFYPKDLKGQLNRNIYHYYVPLYLSLALQKTAPNKKMASIAPLMMTLTYEFITAASDYRYIYNDPARLDPEAYQGKLKDIYASYCAVSKAAEISPRLKLDHLGELFKHSTKKAVGELVR